MAAVYVLDPALAATTARCAGSAAALAGALSALRASLRVRGSDLVIMRCGAGEAGAAVAAAAAAAGAARVFAEAEPLHLWTDAAADAGARLAVDGRSLTLWDAPLHEGGMAGDSYKAHARRRGRRAAPLPAPGAVPPPPPGLHPGLLPTEGELAAMAAGGGGGTPALLSFGAPPAAAAAALAAARGGEHAARVALGAYLASGGAAGTRATAASARAGLVCVAAAAAAAEGPATPGGSFPALFAPSLALGLLSRRRVAADAAAALARLPPFPSLSSPAASAPARAAAAAADASDFHALMAASRSRAPAGGGGAGETRHWRWRGVLTEFLVATPASVGALPLPGAPAMLLVHGFGAFGEQWRGVVADLAARGFTVYAPTLPGYGRSEKPPLPYGQALWGPGFVADFVEGVVGRPVIAAGNSIGGYIVAAAAASRPALFAGVALLNPAGRVDGLATGADAGGGAPMQADEDGSPPPSRLFVETVSRALFLYLELSIGSTLKRLYPTNPGAADDWLAGEIARAAADPGALSVFQSVFYMPRPRALDTLLVREYGGPVAVLQGELDPLNDAKGRARALEAAVPGARVTLLAAGHCPQDEVPDQVAAGLAAFAGECGQGGGRGVGAGGGREAATAVAG